MPPVATGGRTEPIWRFRAYTQNRIANDIRPMLAEEAKERQRAAGKMTHSNQHSQKETQLTADSQEAAAPNLESATEAAKMMGVGAIF